MTFLALLPDSYRGWETLRDELVPFIGERAVTLFSYAISDAADSAECRAFFRQALVESGDDPDNPQVTEVEQLLLEWGRQLALDPHAIEPGFRARLETAFHDRLRLTLIAFAGLTLAATTYTIAAR